MKDMMFNIGDGYISIACKVNTGQLSDFEGAYIALFLNFDCLIKSRGLAKKV